MAGEDDKKFEAALAGFLHRELRDSARAMLCPEAAVLAAYYERALSPEESGECRMHVTGCSRCQQVLGQLAATEQIPAEARRPGSAPAMPPPRSPGRTVAVMRPHPPRWRWAAPAGALAASLLLWLAYHGTRPGRPGPATAVEVAQNRGEARLQQPAGPVPYSENPQQALRKPEKAVSPANPGSRPDRSGVGEAGQGRQPQASGALDRAESSDARAAGAGEKTLPRGQAARTAPVLPEQSNKMPAAPAPAPEPETATGDAIETTAAEGLKQKAARKAEADSPAAGSGQWRATARGNLQLILAPGARAVWRVGAGGSIEYSSNGGKNWQQQDSGVDRELLAGSAPSTSVCWIVGRAGTVLVTTDAGATWRTRTPPAGVDLGGVAATDALHAIVRDVTDRQRFETTDGGQLWNPVTSR
jgi:hypothetical protein